MFKVSFRGKHQLYDDDKPIDLFFLEKEKAIKEVEKYRDSNYYWAQIDKIKVEK